MDLIEGGKAILCLLEEEREAHITAVIALANAKYVLALNTALAENQAVEAAGGEKALGANTDARRRGLLLALDANENYKKAYTAHLDALRDEKLAWAKVQGLEDALGLFKAALYASVGKE